MSKKIKLALIAAGLVILAIVAQPARDDRPQAGPPGNVAPIAVTK